MIYRVLILCSFPKASQESPRTARERMCEWHRLPLFLHKLSSKITYIMSFRLFSSGLVALLVPPYLCSLVHLPSQGRAVWRRIIYESLLSYSYPSYSLRTKTTFVWLNYFVWQLSDNLCLHSSTTFFNRNRD